LLNPARAIAPRRSSVQSIKFFGMIEFSFGADMHRPGRAPLGVPLLLLKCFADIACDAATDRRDPDV
jgi:hypothetical protein